MTTTRSGLFVGRVMHERSFPRRHRLSYGVWYLLAESPYMVAGEVFLPNGQVQKMTEVALP